MGRQHIEDLHNALERAHWNVVGEEESDLDEVPAIWVIARPDGSDHFHIVFGVSQLEEELEHEIERSIGCHLQEAPQVNLDFARISRSWKRGLATFVGKLNAIAQH